MENEKLHQLLETVTGLENQYYEYSFKAMDENNMLGMQIMNAQASAFQRVRYMVESLLGVELTNNFSMEQDEEK